MSESLSATTWVSLLKSNFPMSAPTLSLPVPRHCLKAGRPEVVRNEVYKSRLREQFTVWEEARTLSQIPTLAWWEGTVKSGIRNLLRWRGREMKKNKFFT